MKKTAPLSRTELNFLKAIFQKDQKQTMKFVNNFLEKYYPKESIYVFKSGIAVFGDIPILLVAHLDTVFKKPPVNIYYDREQNVMWSPDGLGADDRAGVYAILTMVSRGYRPCLLFCTDEESGGIGAGQFATIENPFNGLDNGEDLKYIIELDRQGHDDCVFYDCNNPKFIEYIEDFGFIEAWGTFSDISKLAPAWKTAAVNLSIGYQDEHSHEEILNITYMNDTISKVQRMLENLPDKKFEYIAGGWSKRLFSKDNWWSTYAKDYGIDGVVDEYSEAYGISDEQVCAICGSPIKAFESIEIDDYPICVDCYVNPGIVDYCDKCNEAYLIGLSSYDNLCPNCAKEEGFCSDGK